MYYGTLAGLIKGSIADGLDARPAPLARAAAVHAIADQAGLSP